MQVLYKIDALLNRITMYFLLVYGLRAVIGTAIILAFFHVLPFSWVAITASTLVIVVVALIADKYLPIIFDTTSNRSSSLITALILSCILPPSTHLHQLGLCALCSLLAIASKYFIALHHKHIFNPAALAALLLGITGLLPAIWWIGSPSMLPFTIVFGVLVLRKVRRFHMFSAFFAASLIVTICVGLANTETVSYIVQTMLASSPLIFLGTVMLTEPSTTPPRLWQQYIYAGIVGAIFTSQLHFHELSATPEFALIVGNIFAYIQSPKAKLQLVFQQKKELAPGLYDLSFGGANKFHFRPGQYLEWTLATARADSRGNRRVFSIASAPDEDNLHIATRIPAESSSTFKQALLQLRAGDTITAGQLAGDFVMPDNIQQKLVFIAGGIGITPFLSMAQHMIKQHEHRDIVLFYLVNTPREICYADTWVQASKFGLHMVPAVTDMDVASKVHWAGITGRLTDTNIKKYVPSYEQRKYYLSGPPGMVGGYQRLLHSLAIPSRNIVTDYFSGY